MHEYGGGYGGDLGGDEHYDDGDDDDLGSYGKGFGGGGMEETYMDDEPELGGGHHSSYRKSLRGRGKSSKYLLDDEPDLGADGDGDMGPYDDEEEAPGNDFDDLGSAKRKGSNNFSPTKLLSTSSGSLKKYFKRWKRKKPRAALYRSTERENDNSYEEEGTEEDGDDDDQMQNSESGESNVSEYSGESLSSPNELGKIKPIRHKSINSMTKEIQQQQQVNTPLSYQKVSPTQKSSARSQQQPNQNSGEVISSAQQQLQPQQTELPVKKGETELQQELLKKEKSLKKYFKKIKIGQYFKPYMMGSGEAKGDGGASSKEVDSSQKKPSNMSKSKKMPQEVMKSGEFYYHPQSQVAVPSANSQAHHHQMMQSMMLMQATSAAQAHHHHHRLHPQMQHPHPAAITIVEQPGPYGYQVQPMPAGSHLHHQTMFVDPHSGHLVPGGSPHLSHEIVAEQIVVHQGPFIGPPMMKK